MIKDIVDRLLATADQRQVTPSDARAAAAEIERLRGLIVKWADADDDWTDVSAKDGPERAAYAAAHDALRKVVGR